MWQRICRHASGDYGTVQGFLFTSATLGDYLGVTRNGVKVSRTLSKPNLRRAVEQMQIPGQAGLSGREGSSCTWVVLRSSALAPADGEPVSGSQSDLGAEVCS